jgi:TRAP-type C4-dicarboxylate transport system permease large subunit
MAAWVIGTVDSPALYLLLVNLMLLIVGCLIEGLAAMVVLVPILFPIAQQLGIDPLHFATVVVFNLMIGLITPPMGLLLFVADGIAKTGLAPILRQLWPFLIAEIVVLIAVTYIPSLSTFLPALAGYGR